jgi:hypothetical protein
VGEEGVIVNNFYNYNLLRFSTNFELFQRFQAKAGLKDLCSLSLIASLIANRPGFHFGQEVHYGYLQGLY